MVADTDRFYWPKMASAIYNYRLSGNILKSALAYTLPLQYLFLGIWVSEF
jgi:hypothetical protein